jgi:lysylphosphatidylglycerol synthetase-like protein (DUF2156 family)
MKSRIQALFLIDGIGGVATALTTGIVLPRFFDSGGMPDGVLTAFAILGLLCGAYSLCCRFLIRGDNSRFLGPIVIANTLYSMATIAAMVRSYDRLNAIGLVYFLAEVIVILVLVYFEVDALRKSAVN